MSIFIEVDSLVMLVLGSTSSWVDFDIPMSVIIYGVHFIVQSTDSFLIDGRIWWRLGEHRPQALIY